MNKLRVLIGAGIGTLVLYGGTGSAWAASTADVEVDVSSATTVEDEIAGNCLTRTVDYLDNVGVPPIDKWYTRVEIYCTKTPPAGWRVRGLLDVEGGFDKHTPWITSTNSMLLYQWQRGGSIDKGNTPVGGTRLEITTM